MNWFAGSIAEAVAQSKEKNAIFVVYVEGKDENTEKLSKFLNEPLIRGTLEADNFVAIKIQSDSEAYLQFASIYQIVPIPSIFFIGKSGTPLEIVTGIIKTVDELNIKIVKVLEMSGKLSSSASISQTTTKNSVNGDCTNNNVNKNGDMNKMEQEIQNTNVQKSGVLDTNAEIICVDDVCFKKPITSVGTTAIASKGEDLQSDKEIKEGNDKAVIPTTSKSMQIPKVASTVAGNDENEQKKVEETRKYLEQKRRERVEEEQRLEKERELKRRQEGKVIQNLRQWQHEQELKELQENIKREKMEAQAARERIRAQIAADKAERAQKFAQATTPTTGTLAATNAVSNNRFIFGGETASTSTSAAAATTTEMRAIATDETRLQFRFASGLSRAHIFKYTTTLGEVRDYVIDELLIGTGIKDFILATTYPKREFTDEHNAMNLLELNLTPSAVILVIVKGNSSAASAIARSGGLFSMLNSIIWTVINPIIAVVATTCNWIQRRIRGNDAGYLGRRNVNGAQKRLNDENIRQNDSAKRRNLDRFINATEPSTSSKNNINNGNGNNNNNNNNNNNGDKMEAGYRRYRGNSNIHRLSDNRKDSDDENATWNGNSTQQQ